MAIRRKYSLNKISYELMGQQSFFGRDNLSHKTINLPKAQKFINICKKFKLKKIIIKSKLLLPIISKIHI